MKKIILLRGINVGAKRKILMAALKQLFLDLGFQAPKTYIQSGNVIFNDPQFKTDEQLFKIIKEGIKDRFGYDDIPIILRTAEDLQKIVVNNPFIDRGTPQEKLHLTFLSEPVQDHEVLKGDVYAPDIFELAKQEVYIYCENKYHQSKLSNAFFEKKFKCSATTRNWKTVLKLLELSQD